nr:immunoglobulin heavy chain junction region [Macaca mulatta]MOW88751.1 immunoglobulin heavy chain junction region [Macaca mulatta]MOW89054.1 immunoglobulin heavy chain junction region [Macaca mulatta]MOW90975.1 immunoglobulin heavy chain junction region [Macaca mulatta]MOW91300.1 immunoglobulin heavy chain junction region [Macaca mulatta]
CTHYEYTKYGPFDYW